MKKISKLILLSCLLSLLALVLASCSDTPYDEHNDSGFTVSIKYDANGGTFGTNTTVITDSYNISEYKTNESGNKEILLIDPADPVRGETQAYSVSKIGHFFAGWYTERNETTDASGNTVYTYGGHWSFGDKYEVKADGEYDANVPVLTLYAAWIPAEQFKYEFYQINSDGSTSLIGEKALDSLDNSGIKLPGVDNKTGLVGAGDFPKLENMTYTGVYLDKDMTSPVTSEKITHGGGIDLENATAYDTTLKLYCTVKEGVEYEIDTVDKFLAADKKATLILKADLDFEGEYWPTLMLASEFKGKLIGNGHKISNVSISKTNRNATAFGMFGKIAEGAVIENVVFENISASIEIAKVGSFYGIIASEIAEGATVTGVSILNSKMVISSAQIYNTEAVVYGLGAAKGDCSGITIDPTVTVAFENFSGSTSTKEYNVIFEGDGSGIFTLELKEAAE